MYPVRVLHIVTIMDRGGLETMLMTQYRKIDREKLQYDFLVHRQERGAYDDEIESLGGRIFRAQPMTPLGIPSYEKWLLRFFKEHPEYSIVHSSINELSGFILWAAKRAGVKIRISHSHVCKNIWDWKYMFRMVAKLLIPPVSTHLFACSVEAGDSVFGKRNRKRVNIIPNAIDACIFSYDEEKRIAMRRALGISNSFVVGHIGRFDILKNQAFLLKIFEEILKKDDTAILLLIGDGELLEDLQKKAKPFGSAVMFLGSRPDVADLYQAMDVFVFPSISEGLGIVAVEAETSGLPCFISDSVPEQVFITSVTEKIPLSKPPEFWAGKILAGKKVERIDRTKEICDSKYDITAVAEYMQAFYLEMGNS